MKLWKFLSLILVAAGLGVYIFEFEMPEDERKSVAAMPFSTVAKESFKTLELDRRTEIPFTLQNDKVSSEDKDPAGTDWQVMGIAGGTLDTATLDATLKELKNFKIQDALPEKELSTDLGVYGLTDPELKLIASYDGTPQPFEIKFGKRSDFLTKRYVSVSYAGGKGIYLTDEALYNTANKQLADYRNKSPISAPPASVDKVTITRPAENVSFEKKDDGSWTLTTPIQARASSIAINAILNAMTSIKATSFVDGDARTPFDALFHAPLASVSITGKIGQKDISAVSRKEGDAAAEYFVKIAGLDSIIKAAGDPTPDLLKDVIAYREKEYFTFDTFSANAVTATRGADKLEITQADNQWKVNGKDGDRAFIEDYLKTLSTAEAVAYADGIDEAQTGLAQPTVVVNVKGTSKDFDKTLTIGSLNPVDSNQYYAKVNGINEVFFISADTLAKLFPTTEKLVAVMPEPTVAGLQPSS